MAYCSDHKPSILVHKIPENFPNLKLKRQLEKISGEDSILDIIRISPSCIKVTVEDEDVKENLLAKNIRIRFGDRHYLLETEAAYSDSSADEQSDGDEYIYTAPDNAVKAILRYLAHDKDHQNALEKKLSDVGGKLKSVTEDKVQVEATKKSQQGDWRDWNNECETCIEEFIDKYTTWSKKMDNCSSADMKFFASLSEQYKGQCFVKWYASSATLMSTGLKQMVDSVKLAAEKKMQAIVPQRYHLMAVRSHPFEFHDVEPAVMRFVLYHKNYHTKMERRVASLAVCKIEQDDNKTLSVKVMPKQVANMVHAQFENICSLELRSFFSAFAAWKGKFDPDIIRELIRSRPSIFATVNSSDVFKKWHLDSGVVDITGVSEVVTQHQKAIEQELAPYSVPISPSKIKPCNPTRTGRTSSTVEGPASRQEFDTKAIKPAVLKFVFNDSKSKQELEGCCGILANVQIVNEKGQIKIWIESQRKPSRGTVDDMVAKYLRKFMTENVKCDRLKLENAQRRDGTIFEKREGVYVQVFTDTSVVKITGLRHQVKKRIHEVKHAVECEEEEEILPTDIYITQRECDVWKKVEEKCGSVTISPDLNESKITYKGKLADINKARHLLGKLSEELIVHPVGGLTAEKLRFLINCKSSQENSLRTKENWLDPVYAEFRKNGVHGSLSIKDDEVQLFSVNEEEWWSANRILRKCIQEFVIELDRNQSDALSSTAFQKMKELPVYVKRLGTQRKISVSCVKNNMSDMKTEIENIIADVKVEKKFYPMLEQKAKHIKKFCKIDKARSITLSDGNPRHGLYVTFQKEDADLVDMRFEDLELEIVTSDETLKGYNLYEHLTTDGRPFVSVVESETECSIFLAPLHMRKRMAISVSVTAGSILDQTCDAIVISTGKSISLSGQVACALVRKYGSALQTLIEKNSSWLVKDKLCVTKSRGILPWKYLYLIATPSKTELLNDSLLILLRKGEKHHVRSIALPAIGTGNLGLPPSEVSKSMKAAFEAFSEESPTYLTDVRVVVFEPGHLSTFQHAALIKHADTKTTGLTATLYGTDKKNLDEAKRKLQEVSDKHIRTAVIGFDPTEELFDKKKRDISKICDTNKVLAVWENGKCKLEGIVDDVRAAEEQIKKIAQTVFPSYWKPIPGGKRFVRVRLDESSLEYIAVKDKFLESGPSHSQITDIERIQNPSLYKPFKVAKDHLQQLPENLAKNVTMRLFHGTLADNVEKICASNFDRNFAGANGTAYGRGVYFHKASQYSARYSGSGPQKKYMFLADVITGAYTRGDPSYKAPPAKDNSSTLYDSVVDSVTNPNIFVVFRDTSTYPSYLIAFM